MDCDGQTSSLLGHSARVGSKLRERSKILSEGAKPAIKPDTIKSTLNEEPIVMDWSIGITLTVAATDGNEANSSRLPRKVPILDFIVLSLLICLKNYWAAQRCLVHFRTSLWVSRASSFMSPLMSRKSLLSTSSSRSMSPKVGTVIITVSGTLLSAPSFTTRLNV
jgi:hypothetical protein